MQKNLHTRFDLTAAFRYGQTPRFCYIYERYAVKCHNQQTQPQPKL